MAERLMTPLNFGPGRAWAYYMRSNGPKRALRALEVSEVVYNQPGDKEWRAKFRAKNPRLQARDVYLAQREAAIQYTSSSGFTSAKDSSHSDSPASPTSEKVPQSEAPGGESSTVSPLEEGSLEAGHSPEQAAASDPDSSSLHPPNPSPHRQGLGDTLVSGGQGLSGSLLESEGPERERPERYDPERESAERDGDPETPRHTETSRFAEGTDNQADRVSSEDDGDEDYLPSASTSEEDVLVEPRKVSSVVFKLPREEGNAPIQPGKLPRTEESTRPVGDQPTKSGSRRVAPLARVEQPRPRSQKAAKKRRGRESSQDSSSDSCRSRRRHKKKKRHHRRISSSESETERQSRRRHRVRSESPPKGRTPTTKARNTSILMELAADPDQTITLTGEALNRLIMAVQDTASSSSGDDQVTRAQLWKDFREVVAKHNESVPDPTPAASTSAIRASSLKNPLVMENFRLPIHPGTKKHLDFFQEEVKQPKDPKVGHPLPPLSVGKFLTPSEQFRSKYLEALDLVGFSKPLKENFDTPADLIQPSTKVSSVTLTEKDLKAQEADTRETMLIWSAIRWSHDSLAKLIEDEETTPDEKWTQTQTLLKQQRELEPLMEEKLVHSLGNTTLRRRDMVLSALPAGSLTQENLLTLRASSLTEPFIFQYPKDLVTEERELFGNRALMGALTGSKGGQQKQPAHGKGKFFPKKAQLAAAAGSAAQAQAQKAPAPVTSAPAQPQPNPATTQYAGKGKQPFRGKPAFKGRGKGKSAQAKGGKSQQPR